MCSTHTTHIRLHPISVSYEFKIVYALETVRVPICRSVWCVCHLLVWKCQREISHWDLFKFSKWHRPTTLTEISQYYSFLRRAIEVNVILSDSSASISLQKFNISISLLCNGLWLTNILPFSLFIWTDIRYYFNGEIFLLRRYLTWHAEIHTISVELEH